MPRILNEILNAFLSRFAHAIKRTREEKNDSPRKPYAFYTLRTPRERFSRKRFPRCHAKG